MSKLNDVFEITAADFDSVKDIIYESKLIDEKLLNLENAVLFIKDKLSRNKAKIFVKKEQDLVVAFAVLHYKINPLSIAEFNWHISYLYVKTDFRRKSIGREIMTKCFENARENNVRQISLNTDTENFAAHHLYESFGFVRKSFISNYYYYEIKL
ncbi:GNAT family N-acetyltransferase [Flavobacterium fluviatile]|uniref:GNAT family N-acetyltransferase n=1 Tax=Flavobacterium fluviatile TaxID=1862387 RepID=UPI0013D216C3|nr:GNAT family N-acetyltransferase [Flavobacterium fluviatile]